MPYINGGHGWGENYHRNFTQIPDALRFPDPPPGGVSDAVVGGLPEK
jgi:hypothetical protein